MASTPPAAPVDDRQTGSETAPAVSAAAAAAAAASVSVSVRKIVTVVLGLTALLAVLLLAFGLPASNTGAHGVPIGVVADGAGAEQAADQLRGFTVTRYETAAAARTAILHRDIYGALDLSSGGTVRVQVASASSYSAAQLVEQAAGAVASSRGATTTVQDVRPFPADDTHGAGLSAGALPMALGGWIGAVVIMLLIQTPGRRVAAALGLAVAGGFALTAVIRFVIGTFDTNYLITSTGAMLGLAATAMTVLGLRNLLGGLGLGIAAIALVVLGNPLSGLASAPEMLPRPWGALGQFLPPGAVGTLLRDLALFDGHGSTRPLLVLLGWLAGGCLCFWLGVRRNRDQLQSEHLESEIEEAIGETPAVA
ncbi:hypothetical protein CcI49_13570 [Frankia sp. CcI49]|uniref:hypothetical protein n=1 Tax=Frankia sp. CcI49 TaxID=1745382 RepID=UPI0009762CA0|nr:hypothetical protein [Frankia sp. CcI49]ONH59777.1 hypothetical protein CcI49_13570 [Frankia sp. CcI49]